MTSHACEQEVLRSTQGCFNSYNDSGQVVHIHASITKQYQLKPTTGFTVIGRLSAQEWDQIRPRRPYPVYAVVTGCIATTYNLVGLCQSVSSVASRQHLRSASRGLLVVPRHRLSSYGRRVFSVSGPAIWNWLPDSLRDQAISRDSFRRSLKKFFLFSAYSCR